MSPVESDRASVEARRRQSHSVLVVSMAASVVIHAFLCLVTPIPAPVANRSVKRAAALPDHPLGILISRIVVAEPATQLETAEAATEEFGAELAESGPVDPLLTPKTGSAVPSPIPDIEPPRGTKAAPAAALGGHLANPLLWLDIRSVFADSAFTSVVPMSVGVGRRGPRTTPIDPWAFATWTTTDARGRLWGAGPGMIYLGGIAIPTCSERFDASNCGFGLPVERRGEYQFFLRAWTEIERQKQWGAIMERVRTMRERRERERDTIPST